MAWKKKNGSERSSSVVSPCSGHESEKVPRGHVPLITCSGHESEKVPRGHVPLITCSGERVVVPVRLLTAPCIAKLLDMAAQQYGYGQPGVLRIPCDVEHFRLAVDCALQRGG